VAVLLAVANAVWLIRVSRRPQLPPTVRHPSLPKAFDDEVRNRTDVAESDGNPDAIRRLAALYQANRLFDEARQCYRAVAARPPGLSARDHYFLSAIDLEESDMDAAKDELGFVLAAEPRYTPASLMLAEVLFKTGHADDAATHYQAVLSAEPDNALASLGLARVSLQHGKDDEAVARLRKVVSRHPEMSSAEALLSQILDRRGLTEQAAALRALSQQVHDPVPPDPWLRSLLPDCYDAQALGIAFEQFRLSGQLGEALPLLDRLELLDPSSWMPHMLRGWSQKEAGNLDAAVHEYRLALARGGDPETICPLAVAALLKAGKPADAAELLSEYHKRLPKSVPILKSYCEVAVKSGDTALAKGLLHEVLALDPYLYMANMSLVQILWSEGDRDGAAETLLRVARVYPADIDSRGILGQYYLEKSEPESGIPYLEEAVALLGGSADPRRQRIVGVLVRSYLVAGGTEGADGHLAKAEAYADRAIALRPAESRAYVLKVNACKALHEYPAAAAALEKWVAQNPGHPEMVMSLGDLRQLAGDAAGARIAWQDALGMAPAGDAALRAAIEGRLAGRISPE